MKIFAVANQKGGVGKTTTVVSLGGILVRRGYRVLLLDMDPHGSMSSYFGLDPDYVEYSLYDLFQSYPMPAVVVPQQVIQDTRFENLKLLPASTAIATLDRQLGTSNGMGLVVSQTLKKLESQFDFALIDCPPLLGVLMVNALVACHHLVIPVQTEFLALKGLERMLRTLDMIARANHPVPNFTIMPTMFDQRTRASVSTLKVLQKQHAQHLWNSVIPIDTQFREASRLGVPLPLKSPGDRGSRAYEALLDDLLGAASQGRPSRAVASV